MSFLVSKPERIRVSVSILPALLFLFSVKQCVLADIVGRFYVMLRILWKGGMWEVKQILQPPFLRKELAGRG